MDLTVSRFLLKSGRPSEEAVKALLRHRCGADHVKLAAAHAAVFHSIQEVDRDRVHATEPDGGEKRSARASGDQGGGIVID
jgi:hypothetical protein